MKYQMQGDGVQSETARSMFRNRMVTGSLREIEPEVLQSAPPRRKARPRRRLLSLFFLTATVVLAESSLAPEQVVEEYVRASRIAARNPQDELMRVQIDARLPKLHKHGALQALKFVSRLGSASYRPMAFQGDQMIEKSVIARYLSAEEEAGARDARVLAVTPANYRFHFERVSDYNGARAYVFRLKPRRKQLGLFRGELWLDAGTFLPLRQWGELVKSPSFFVKTVYFVRDYTIIGQRSVPRRTIAKLDTRLVGTAELTIWFDPIALGDQAPDALRRVAAKRLLPQCERTLPGMTNADIASDACRL